MLDVMQMFFFSFPCSVFVKKVVLFQRKIVDCVVPDFFFVAPFFFAEDLVGTVLPDNF